MGRINRRQVVKAGLGVIGLAASSKFSFAVAQREEPLRIGVVLSYSGPYARLGQEITRGMELYLERLNLQAGGRRIQLLKEDEEADPAVALRGKPPPPTLLSGKLRGPTHERPLRALHSPKLLGRRRSGIQKGHLDLCGFMSYDTVRQQKGGVG
jgi:hypothetical protein